MEKHFSSFKLFLFFLTPEKTHKLSSLKFIFHMDDKVRRALYVSKSERTFSFFFWNIFENQRSIKFNDLLSKWMSFLIFYVSFSFWIFLKCFSFYWMLMWFAFLKLLLQWMSFRFHGFIVISGCWILQLQWTNLLFWERIYFWYDRYVCSLVSFSQTFLWIFYKEIPFNGTERVCKEWLLHCKMLWCSFKPRF